ncbi:ATP-binding protein [Planomonospora parontospora subsp. parontospora]|uniref:ATP-binding protein n=2 Tax=Planomonospora parontospora TaxID=58119 RepID=A0AA37BIZ0_9ACTN|nr:MoxR family ATPase [Planomonospora parontospora]GGK75858.1 ATP-binding protein [Planomonospora parontospora]GII09429.1 ATP-binding protein [Planomonospora parontospora subsp. parontospora]
MQATVTVTPAQLPGVLLHVAVVRPVFLWGAPGIGKSSLVRDFADALGLECVTMLGTQLAPEDLIGVPELVGGRSRFAPPETIARDEPYCLFLDELNASAPEVQKAFYSLILDRRIGAYELPAGSVVIGAGNRATDNALARPMASALVNRLVHVHLRASATDWLTWATGNGIHPWIVEYLTQRPDHLWSAPPKTEEPFSSPRAWHMLSDVMHSYGDGIDDDTLALLAFGTLTTAHASAFRAYVKTVRHAYDLDAVLKGDVPWPRAPEERDLLYFLSETFRARLMKELPADKRGASSRGRDLAFRAKTLLVELAEISLECAQLVIANDANGAPALPTWFLVEVGRDLPRLVAARN